MADLTCLVDSLPQFVLTHLFVQTQPPSSESLKVVNIIDLQEVLRDSLDIWLCASILTPYTFNAPCSVFLIKSPQKT